MHKQIAVDKAAVTAKQEEYRSPIRTEERVPRGSHARSSELVRGTPAMCTVNDGRMGRTVDLDDRVTTRRLSRDIA